MEQKKIKFVIVSSSEHISLPEQGQPVSQGKRRSNAEPSLLQTSLLESISQQSSAWDHPPAYKPQTPQLLESEANKDFQPGLQVSFTHLNNSTTFSPSFFASSSGSMLKMEAFWKTYTACKNNKKKKKRV